MAQEFDIELMNNQEQRLPCILILDTSASMSGEPIQELQSGLDYFAKDVQADDDACQKVQIMVIKCGGDANFSSKPTLIKLTLLSLIFSLCMPRSNRDAVVSINSDVVLSGPATAIPLPNSIESINPVIRVLTFMFMSLKPCGTYYQYY